MGMYEIDFFSNYIFSQEVPPEFAQSQGKCSSQDAI